MTAKRGGLGKGLDSLIKENKTAKHTAPVKKEVVNAGPIMMKINDVEPNRDQPRKHFEEDALLELADSIKQFGILQPLIVQKRNDYYEIIAGERRWRAAKQAGIKEIPVIIKEYTDQEIVEISLIENIQRENLNPIEEAQAYKRLLNEFTLKQDEVAERVSKSRTAVTNSMRLLKLDDRVQQMIIDDMISSGESMLDVARELKRRKARRVFCISTFGMFTNGLESFDKAYEEGLIYKVITTNCTYQRPDLFERPWYVSCDVAKYIALLIDSINHEASISAILNPHDRITKRLEEYKQFHTIKEDK